MKKQYEPLIISNDKETFDNLFIIRPSAKTYKRAYKRGANLTIQCEIEAGDKELKYTVNKEDYGFFDKYKNQVMLSNKNQLLVNTSYVISCLSNRLLASVCEHVTKYPEQWENINPKLISLLTLEWIGRCK